ncbi:CCA tRNA nucleotidyltransferase [Paenibacillus tianjinensis]|uniref:CCA tRNA nucleotidyltransferase n=1 Tax=Paenibacillus tianjinensis TaxID=2810347 RepID=A0ABX7L9R2_9BACL|nr:CCA tRNA nucleotidyltransferase [Paenibacillus tianjinensis]QSF43165.1 CCA tRNA nucleotidyltransferase [Paenibacillus tianjinensis]
MEWTMAPSGMAEAAGKVIAGLLQSGREAYYVGGCIRDELLGRPVHDMDLTTSALPEEVMALFTRCIPTGLAHGTVTVLQDGYSFEVTTYRTESGYADHRRPEHVFFVSDVKEDLRRRDFTINAICCGLDGVLVDPFGGARDLSAQLIRCVGLAEERFDEDALRMLRCIRFASVLDFAVAKNTWRGLLRQRDKLAHIAVERVRSETERIIEGPHPWRGLGLLARSGLLPRGKAPFPWTGSELTAAAAILPGIGELQSARLRWALLLHALGQSAASADELLRAWTFPGATRSAVARVLRVREAWDAALASAPVGTGAEEALRRRWIAAVLALGTEAAEGWLTLLEAVPQAACVTLGGAQPPGSQSGSGTAGEPDVLFRQPTPDSIVQRHDKSASVASASQWTQAPVPDAPGAAAPLHIPPSRLRSWMAGMPLSSLAELAVTGKELSAALDKRPGPWLGELLQRLLHAVAAGDIPNDKQLLLQEAKKDGYK